VRRLVTAEQQDRLAPPRVGEPAGEKIEHPLARFATGDFAEVAGDEEFLQREVQEAVRAVALLEDAAALPCLAQEVVYSRPELVLAAQDRPQRRLLDLAALVGALVVHVEGEVLRHVAVQHPVE